MVEYFSTTYEVGLEIADVDVPAFEALGDADKASIRRQAYEEVVDIADEAGPGVWEVGTDGLPTPDQIVEDVEATLALSKTNYTLNTASRKVIHIYVNGHWICYTIYDLLDEDGNQLIYGYRPDGDPDTTIKVKYRMFVSSGHSWEGQ